jgi:hypothetical protein
MNDRKPIELLAAAFNEAEEEIGWFIKAKLSAFLADAKGLSRRGREALIEVYAGETKLAVIDRFAQALHDASERLPAKGTPKQGSGRR